MVRMIIPADRAECSFPMRKVPSIQDAAPPDLSASPLAKGRLSCSKIGDRANRYHFSKWHPDFSLTYSCSSTQKLILPQNAC